MCKSKERHCKEQLHGVEILNMNKQRGSYGDFSEGQLNMNRLELFYS